MGQKDRSFIKHYISQQVREKQPGGKFVVCPRA